MDSRDAKVEKGKTHTPNAFVVAECPACGKQLVTTDAVYAAAPDLLAVLEAIIETGDCSFDMERKVRAAIAKARGEA